MRPRSESANGKPPLTHYDQLAIAAIKQEIQNLTADELRPIAEYERKHRNRKTLLSYIQRRIASIEAESEIVG